MAGRALAVWRRPGLEAALLVGLVSTAQAQPAVNAGALDALKPSPPTKTRPALHPAPRPNATRNGDRNAGRPAPAAVPVPPKPPVVPTVPPAIAAIPPAVAVPVQRPPEPPPIAVAADAPGAASPEPGGVRTTFGPTRADLNPATEAAIRSFARPLRSGDQSINVLAYAAGGPDDPSTPRRLSLARALAARAVLINEGIASTRIYVRALGAAGGDGPPDRVDLTTGTSTPSATTSNASAPSPTTPAAKR